MLLVIISYTGWYVSFKVQWSFSSHLIWTVEGQNIFLTDALMVHQNVLD
jgi:hypothetical protein